MASRAQPGAWRETVKAGAARSRALFGGIALGLATLLLTLALVSFRSGDPSLNTASAGPPKNLLGGGGAVVADLMLTAAGPVIVLLMPLASFWLPDCGAGCRPTTGGRWSCGRASAWR